MEEGKIPKHIAIIMDGNGRWAKKQGLARGYGHREGMKPVRRAVEFCRNKGISCLTVFAFSTENWKRPASEVNIIMGILREYLYSETPELNANGVKVRFIGDISVLPQECREAIYYSEKTTEKNDSLTLNIACNYGGRADILRAVKTLAAKAVQGDIEPEELTEDDISAELYTSGCPDPDMIIRTGAEKRISNFLIWQGAYSELYFTDKLWPDITEDDLEEAVQWYSERQRRYGGLK